MAMRAVFDGVGAAKQLGGPLEQRRPAPKDDLLLSAARNAPFDADPMTAEEQQALERYRQKKRAARGA